MTTYRQSSEKGDTTVTQPSRSAPKTWLAIVLLSIVAALTGACGGGGATPTQSNDLSVLDLLPADNSILYAGVPYTFTILGGRKPYFIASGDFSIIPINEFINGNQFTVVASNPGVIDANLQPGEVPQRTVTISVRDSGSGLANTTSGITVTRVYKVAQNFLTGYTVGYVNACAAAALGAAASQACSGQDSVANISPITSGILSGGRAMRVERLTGDYDWVVEATGQLQSTLNFTTNHNGVGIARLRVRPGAVTQIATYRLIDVASSLNTIQQFIITASPPPGTLTLIPSTLSFTSATTTKCGTGSADVMIFDGAPPYQILNTSPNLSVNPTTVVAPNNTFTVNAFNQSICLTNATVVVTDSQGRRATLTVNTAAGTTAPPALVVSPAAVTVTCTANVATVAVVGGLGANSAVSSSPRVSATVSGNTLQITRLLGDPPPGPYPTAVTVSVTDGTSIASVAVTTDPFCP
jgi:hypothetical protein